MRRAVAIAAITGWVFALFLFLPDIKNFLLTHPLWHIVLAAVPGIAVLVLAWFELRHTAEANTLRADANRLRSEQIDLQNQIGELTAELAAERNKHLPQIAENSKKPADIPAFAKGGMAYHATYSKSGSSERRTIYVYAAKDGSNSFLLEASTGQKVIGNNEEISKQFSVLQIEYEAAGFEPANSGTGGTLHRLFIR
jgi:hypothetical protein